MAEFDAFGRKRGEDPLEELGWKVGEPFHAPQPTPATSGDPLTQPVPVSPRPAPAPASAQVPPVTPAATITPPAWTAARTSAAPTFVHRRRLPFGRLILLIVLVSVGFGGWAIVGQVSDTVRTAVDSLPSIPTTVPGGAPKGEEGEAPAPPAKPPRGLARGSLVRPENLGRSVQRLRAQKGGLRSLTVRPERLDAQLVTSGGRMRNVQITYEGGLAVISTTGPGFGGVPTIPFARVNTRAAARLVRAAARRMKRSTTGLDYVSLLDVGGAPVWGAYFKSGAIFQGDPQGRILRRIS